jgi:HAD superfamily hydrolase (TIGR01509 family)
MPDREIRAVFFDFGGTLFTYGDVRGRWFYPLLVEAVEWLGVDVEPKAAGRAYAEASQESFRAFHARPYYLHRELFQDAFRRFGEAIGGKPTQEFLDWFHERQRKLVYDRFQLRPDCVETLRELRGDSIHVSIVSNIDDDYLHPMLERCGLTEHLDAWTSSEEARSCKPDAEIFHYSMRKAGVRPEESVFVGDSPEHDVVGARRLGMHTVLIHSPLAEPPGSGAGESAEPDHTIDRLEELIPIVRSVGS